MTFSEVIGKIMPEADKNSEEPFIVFCDKNGSWQFAYTKNQFGENFDWMEGIKNQDPFAVTLTGADLSGGSFPYVYDRVLNERLRAEYEAIGVTDKYDEFHALINMVEENIGELSSEVTDYLTTLDKPLVALSEMTSISLITDNPDFHYDVDKVGDFIDTIESEISKRLGNLNKQPNQKQAIFLLNNGEEIKVIPDDYTELQSQQINGRLITLSENRQAEYRYMVCECNWLNPIGIKETAFTGVTNNYLEALEKYTDTVKYYVECAMSTWDLRRSFHGVEYSVLAEKDCIPNGLDDNLEGKVIIIKSEALAPQYQTADYQLRICNGGFGASPNSRGRAVFCTDLFDDKSSRFERQDILGVANIAVLPEWAKKRISELQENKTTEKESTTNKKPSLLNRVEKGKIKSHNAALNKGKSTVKKKNQDKGVGD